MKLAIRRARAERFGGIVEIERPRALLYVDRDRMRSLGEASSSLWEGADDGRPGGLDTSPLSAPTEVHLLLSRRCAAGCRGCYVDATPQGAILGLEDACRILDELAEMKVFHVALGGGEAIELDHLFAVAEHARHRGIVPNLTTSGLGLTAEMAPRCAVFGQINVSIDGVGDDYRRARGFDGFPHAERALRLLRAVKREVGINCVVSRSSFAALPAVARLARRLRLNELELLRFKPVGRGRDLDEELTPAQALSLYPLARRLLFQGVRIKLDCSFAPMVFAHGPSQRAASFLGVQGCVGGDVLAAVGPEGRVAGCSFAGPAEADARVPGAMRAAWPQGFGAFRTFARSAPEPCASCEYLQLCRGGCRAVAAAHGAFADPDPGCPRVAAYRAKGTRHFPVLPS